MKESVGDAVPLPVGAASIWTPKLALGLFLNHFEFLDGKNIHSKLHG